MENLNLKEELRKSENSLLIVGIIIIAIVLCLWLFFQRLYHGYFIGYLIGAISYISLVEMFLLLFQKASKATFAILIITNFKLIIIGLLVYGLHKYCQIKVTHMVFGLFFSQLVITVALLQMYLRQKSKRKISQKPPKK